uniref:Uncharacterized protein n=1 Tax=Setaria viridis TaxID=4556 RepID=A0A4U6U173_SETVI|nr:hypothetical protein SEVIR_6G078750v2 [Setaria viridis]
MHLLDVPSAVDGKAMEATRWGNLATDGTASGAGQGLRCKSLPICVSDVSSTIFVGCTTPLDSCKVRRAANDGSQTQK